MEGQLFQFFDVSGTTLATDAQLAEALSRGMTPLCATLTDASIHYIENRREELAQMQWKLVRDQMTAATGKIAALNRLVTEMQGQLESVKGENATALERTRNEFFRALDTEREVAAAETRQLGERVNAIAQLVSGERNKREATIAGIEKSIQTVRDMFDAERDSHRQDVSMYMSAFQEAKAAVEGEKTSREAFEDRHQFELHQVTERIDTSSRHFADLLQDQVQFFRQSTADCNSSLQQQSLLVVKLRGELEESVRKTEMHLTDTSKRLRELDNRVESSMRGIDRQAASIQNAMERREKQLESKVSQAAAEASPNSAGSMRAPIVAGSMSPLMPSARLCSSPGGSVTTAAANPIQGYGSMSVPHPGGQVPPLVQTATQALLSPRVPETGTLDLRKFVAHSGSPRGSLRTASPTTSQAGPLRSQYNLSPRSKQQHIPLRQVSVGSAQQRQAGGTGSSTVPVATAALVLERRVDVSFN
jgi:hypothetical protein